MNLLEKQSEVSSWFTQAAIGKIRIKQQAKIKAGKKNEAGKDLTVQEMEYELKGLKTTNLALGSINGNQG